MRSARFTTALVLSALAYSNTGYAQTPSAEQILGQFRPTQSDIEYDTPDPKDFAKCKVEIERQNGSAGFVVYGPTGEVLRRFTDTNGDSKADLFRYYRMGLEVYRDIDSDKNEKPDQHRWMNWGGMRWGIDKNEDGRIDSWRMLSAQEAARIAVESMVRGDVATLATVMINVDDIRAIQASAEIGKQLLQGTADPATELRNIMGASRSLNAKSKWVRFDPPSPSLVPREDGKAEADLIVFENAMAIIENGESHELVSIGEMIKIGEVWKLTQIPRPLDSQNAQIQLGGVMMQPQLTSGGFGGPPEMAKEMEQLLGELQKLDENSPTTNVTPEALSRYNQARADVIEKVIRIAPTDQERLQWIQQYADGIAAAVQTGQYDDGLKRLTALQDQVKANDDLLGYVWYRRLLAEYAVRLKIEDNDQRQAAQDWWLKQLEYYAQKWPKSDDASDAIVQLAISLELMGRLDDAKRWYSQLVTDHANTNAGIRARGALRRLNLAGRPLQLEGRNLTGQTISAAQYKSKVTLVVFWATWAKPYTDELPKLSQIHAKYQRSGFEILGVNLDSDASGIKDYLTRYGGNWQHIHDAGGTDGQLAKEFGIVSVPTMFIVDKAGKVAGAVTTENLEEAVKTLLLGESLDSAARQGAISAPVAR